MAIIDNSERWIMTPGISGFPRWVYSIAGTYSADTLRQLERDTVNGQRIRFTLLPNAAELVAMRTDGSAIPIPLVSIRPTGWDNVITSCVALGPVTMQELAPAQSGGTYDGLHMVTYSLAYQQLLYNHF